MRQNSGEQNRLATPGELSLSRGFETRDANPNAVLIFLGGLLWTILLVCLISWGLFRYLGVTQAGPSSPSVFYGVRQLPPAPELQTRPRDELMQLQSSQQQELETYGWEDRQAGTVRIPIDRAMDLFLQQEAAARSTKAQRQSSDKGAPQEK